MLDICYYVQRHNIYAKIFFNTRKERNTFHCAIKENNLKATGPPQKRFLVIDRRINKTWNIRAFCRNIPRNI